MNNYTILAENEIGAIIGDGDGQITEVDATRYAEIEADARFYCPLKENRGGLIAFSGPRTGLKVQAVFDPSDNMWFVAL